MPPAPARLLTPVERARERSMIVTLALDTAITVPQIIVTIWSGSLTMLAELTRALLLMALEFFVFHTLRQIHRRRLVQYDYGTGKLEQFANLLVGAAMLLGAAWIVVKMAGRLNVPAVQDADGLMATAVVGFANVLLNGYCFWRLWQSGQDGTSIIMNGQIRSRLAKLAASLLVAVAMLANALATSPGMALAADLAGSGLVVVVMVIVGGGLWRQAMPHLLDQTLDEKGQAAVNRVLARHFDDYQRLSHVHARLNGKDALVEIGLIFDGTTPMATAQAVADRVAGDVAALVRGARITVIPIAGGA